MRGKRWDEIAHLVCALEDIDDASLCELLVGESAVEGEVGQLCLLHRE